MYNVKPSEVQIRTLAAELGLAIARMHGVSCHFYTFFPAITWIALHIISFIFWLGCCICKFILNVSFSAKLFTLIWSRRTFWWMMKGIWTWWTLGPQMSITIIQNILGPKSAELLSTFLPSQLFVMKLHRWVHI